MSLISTLSSNVARNAPSGALIAFLICPRIPETVRMLAPSNRATSSGDVNIPLINAVFLNTLAGCPVSLSFLTTSDDLSSSRTTPVAAIRKSDDLPATVCTARQPVAGGVTGPYSEAMQWLCSGVYLSARIRASRSLIA